mmetsp:Transcript_354/g.481  ORF Transcript_354/g.481 Transcript_354/m.481 type:complete len:851 (-) Transcript_354:27-2579(-)
MATTRQEPKSLNNNNNSKNNRDDTESDTDTEEYFDDNEIGKQAPKSVLKTPKVERNDKYRQLVLQAVKDFDMLWTNNVEKKKYFYNNINFLERRIQKSQNILLRESTDTYSRSKVIARNHSTVFERLPDAENAGEMVARVRSVSADDSYAPFYLYSGRSLTKEDLINPGPKLFRQVTSTNLDGAPEPAPRVKTREEILAELKAPIPKIVLKRNPGHTIQTVKERRHSSMQVSPNWANDLRQRAISVAMESPTRSQINRGRNVTHTVSLQNKTNNNNNDTEALAKKRSESAPTKKDKKKKVQFHKETKEKTLDNKLDTDMSTFELGLYFPDDLDPKDDTLFVTLGIETGSISQGIVTEPGPTGRPEIVAGHWEYLVSRLADHRVIDGEYAKDFLYSFRYIIGPWKLLSMLIDRYHYKPPSDAPKADIKYYDKYEKAVKLRVVNILRKWITYHFYDFMEEKRLLKSLTSFLKDSVEKDFGPKWSMSLLAIIQERSPQPAELAIDSPPEIIEATMRRPDSDMVFRRLNHKKQYFNLCFAGGDFQNWITSTLKTTKPKADELANLMIQRGLVIPMDSKKKPFDRDSTYRLVNKPVQQTPRPIKPKNIPAQLKFLDIHPQELARQLTLIAYEEINTVTCRELTEVVHMQGAVTTLKSPNAEKVLERSDRIVIWVASEISMSVNSNQRSEVIKRFIQISDYCLQCNNFLDADAILNGLKHPAAQKMQRNWKTLQKNILKLYQGLEEIFSSHNELLRRMNAAQPPLVPLLDVYIEELNDKVSKLPDFLEDGMVNFQKLRLQAQIFEQFERYRNGLKYGFKPIVKYQNFLRNDVTLLKESDLMKYASSDSESAHEFKF